MYHLKALALKVLRALLIKLRGEPRRTKEREPLNAKCRKCGDRRHCGNDHRNAPDEGNMIGALIERRANLFQTIELQDEIASLKGQIAGIVVTPPRRALHVVERL